MHVCSYTSKGIQKLYWQEGFHTVIAGIMLWYNNEAKESGMISSEKTVRSGGWGLWSDLQ